MIAAKIQKVDTVKPFYGIVKKLLVFFKGFFGVEQIARYNEDLYIVRGGVFDGSSESRADFRTA